MRQLETEMVLAAILAKNRKNGQKWDSGPRVSKNSPTYRIVMYDIFDRAVRKEFEPEEKTGNRSSFVRHFDEKPSKMAENHRKSVRISRILAPSYSGGLGDAPRSPVRLRIRRVLFGHIKSVVLFRRRSSSLQTHNMMCGRL